MGKLQRRVGDELKLYVRQMAWLHATPKPPKGSKRAEQANQAPQVSRIDQMKQRHMKPKMPPNPMPHITDWLIEMGLNEAAGMGAAPLSWQEIDAWCRRTRVNLSPYESRLIRMLSAAYLAESREAESENRPAPWRGNAAVTKQEKQAEISALDDVLG